ncbi:MAG: 26S proteasome non-ATPase regulatory subunit [Candelina mexicana]|nr:MAG: 26S proteasome non-ATPase regulatory subunit [Candelina mexicana]
MVEKRSLRSSKSDSSSSTNGEKAKSGSQSKPTPVRSTSTKGKTAASKSATPSTAPTESSEGTRPNGTTPKENGVNGTDDVEMGDLPADIVDQSAKEKGKEGEDEMVVVVPPSKGAKLAGDTEKEEDEDTTMGGVQPTKASTAEEGKVDPVAKAISDIKDNFALLERAVAQFDGRFTLRVLRSISSIRKRLTADILAQVITQTYPPTSNIAKTLLAAIGKQDASFEKPSISSEMEIDNDAKAPPTHASKPSSTPKEMLPEVDIYLSILVQIYLLDSKSIELGAKFSSNLVERIHTLNRRTLDSLSARVYFYLSMFYEQLTPLPPSNMASVIFIRQPLLSALRTSVLRKDQDTQATVTTLLLRNYLSTSHISQADLLVSHTQFPPAASSNQIARYLYYLGRIRAIQLSYTEAHEHLIGATRKSPSSACAAGFYQASNKLLIVVQLLMGDIPDRAIFRQPSLERALQPYFLLIQAVRVGDLEGFLKVVQVYNSTFRRDGTYTLVLRLRQNVIKTGIRMMSLSYSRISLRDICLRLGLGSEESAEYIVAKAIRDGVVEATLDHEKGFMKSKDVGDVYATREPGEAFHGRIRACLDLHDESVKAMRFPMNQHRLELKNAQEARERERELAKEIQEGDIDEDDAGGDFEGLIDVSIRLRRAILLNDLSLVKRITKNNPKSLRNADIADKGNTSLHLAAKYGFLDIVLHLIEAGHEDEGISRNADWDTPLIYAANGHEEVARVLAERFESCVNWRNKQGVDAMMTASRHGSSDIVSILLSHSASVTAQDNDGNTALHYASAYGQLKVIRTLLHANASPLARNAYSWTPISYSSTVAAEVYFKNLVAEFERRRAEVLREERRKLGGGVRLVTSEEVRSARMVGGDAGERRAQTPTVGRSEGWGFQGVRARASSGD